MPLLLRVLLLLLCCLTQGVRAEATLEWLQLSRTDEGLRLGYSVKLELPGVAEDALKKGLPLYFVAQARLVRERWWWRDATVARSERQWRLSYQPLTRQYRLSTGGLHQQYESLAEALGALRRASAWDIELREQPDPGQSYRLSFELRLDTSQFPGPLQIGLGAGAQWGVRSERAALPAELGLAS